MWRGEAGPIGALASAALLPLEAVFRVGGAVRGAAFDAGVARAHPAALPTVSVGNLTVGGTGKTPVAGWIVRALSAMGRRPAVVARGYGADELDLHARWAPDVPVVANADRVEGVLRAAAEGADVAVLDDAFQHRRIARDVDVVLVAAETPFPGPLLPRGPYREPASALRRADLVIVTRKAASLDRARAIEAAVERTAPGVACARVHLAPEAITPIGAWARGGGGAPPPAGASIRVVTGVADPSTVEAAVASLGYEVAGRIDFPDHHEFGPAEFGRACQGADAVVITEKDAVKIARFDPPGAPVFVLAQRVRFEAGEGAIRAMLEWLSAAAESGGAVPAASLDGEAT
jgi:tetraacyldisaccharide 4'-kinase